MKKRFILLVDLEDRSKSLLNFAGKWATATGAELLVINQVMSMAPGFGEQEIRKEIKRQERKNALNELTHYVSQALDASVEAKFYVTTGSLETAIHKLRSSDTLDLIFVGIRSKNWLERIFLQSTAMRLYNEVNTMVIAMPLDATIDDFSGVNIAVSTRFPVNEAAFSKLLAITAGIGKSVTVFSVLTLGADPSETRAYLKHLCNLSEHADFVQHEIVYHDNTLKGITEFMAASNRILALQKGTRDLTDYFRPQVVDDLLHESKMPVLILP